MYFASIILILAKVAIAQIAACHFDLEPRAWRSLRSASADGDLYSCAAYVNACPYSNAYAEAFDRHFVC